MRVCLKGFSDLLRSAVGIVLVAVSSVSCLKLTNMSVPAVIDFREDMKLDCQFDMGGELLYAVKWYKDDNEFFRYMPHQQPHILTFPVFGVQLVTEATKCGSTSCQVLLSNLLRVKSGGSYRCEVSSEAPAFRLASETHNVTVAAVPENNPSIEGLDPSYYIGEILTAKCISSPSDPPQLITWFINKEQVDPNLVRDMKTSKPDEQGMATTSQLVRLVVNEKYGKYIEMSCVAAFPNTPASARETSKRVIVQDHSVQQSDPKYTYWLSSSNSATLYNPILTITVFVFLRVR